MNIYILSHRSLNSSVSWDPVFELEDLLVQTCNAKLLTPTARLVTQKLRKNPNFLYNNVQKIVRRTVGFYNPVIEKIDSLNKPNILLMICISKSEISLLSSIPHWRKKFDLVAAYVFDAWGFKYLPKEARQIDHLFVPMPEVINTLKQLLKIPVSLLPFGADALTHGSDKGNRPLDLISYGRIPQQYHHTFFQEFNQPKSPRFYYRGTPRAVEDFPKLAYADRKDKEDRQMLFQMLRRTKIAFAFDTLYPGMRVFPHSFVTLRWFECGAAGCAIVGKRPTTPLANKLLNWEDSTIELPDDPQASVKLVEELLEDSQRLAFIHKRNYRENLARHDWRHRIKSMLEILNIPLPPVLSQQLSQIEQLSQTLSKVS